MGSKYKLLPQLDKLLDKSKNRFYDMFSGGGAVAMNLGLHYTSVYMNDLLSTGIHKELYDKGDAFVIQMKSHLVSKTDQAGYLVLREKYNLNPTPAKLWALILSCNSNMMRFNKQGKFNQTFGKRTFNSSTKAKVKDYLDRVKLFEDKQIPIIHSQKDFKKLSGYYTKNTIVGAWFDDPGGMIYIDPPYYNTEAGYNVFWSLEDEYTLLNNCLNSKASIAVSGCFFTHKENSPLLEGLRELNWHIHYLDMSYDKARKNKKGEYQEVLITNYDRKV